MADFRGRALTIFCLQQNLYCSYKSTLLTKEAPRQQLLGRFFWQELMSGNITFADELEFEASKLNLIFEEPETGATKGSQKLSNV